MKAGYSYKADGLRIQKNVNGEVTNHIWDGFHMAADTGDGYEEVSVNVRGINLIYNTDQGYYIYNAHGDVVELTDGTGTVIKEYDYDAFGVEKDIDVYHRRSYQGWVELVYIL